MFLLDWINEEFFTLMTYELNDFTFGMFKFNSTVFNYNNGYLSLGFTIDWKNSSFFKNTTKKYFNL
jgi:hypothetical protein